MKQNILILIITLPAFFLRSGGTFAQVPSDTIRARAWDSIAIKLLDYRFSAEAARPYLDSLEKVRSKFPGADSIPYANRLFYEALYSYYKGNPNQGVKLMLEVIRLRENSGKYPRNSHPMASAHNMLGLLLSNAGQHDLALAHHRHAMEIRESIARRGGAFTFKNMLAYSYANVGQELGYLGENDQSIAFILRALPDIRDSARYHYEMKGFVAALYSNLGSNYLDTRDHALAEYYFRQALGMMGSSLGKEDLWPSDQLAQIWVGLGSNYAFQLKSDSSERCFEKAKQILSRIHPGQGERLAVGVMYQIQGMLSLDLGNFAQGEMQLRESLRIFKSVEGERHVDVSRVYFTLGYGFYLQNKPDSTISCARLSEQALGEQPEEKSFLHFARSKSLAGKAWVQKYRNETVKDIGLLKQAIAEAGVVETAFGHYVSSLEGELRFFSMAAGLKQAFEPALAAHLLLYRLDSQQTHLEEAFRLSEKTKALSWLEKFRFQHNFKAGDSLPALEQQFRKQLADLKTRRYSILSQNSDTATVESGAIDQKIFELSRRRDAYLKSLKEGNPALSNALYNAEVDTTTIIQRGLAANEVLLSYFIGDSSVFIFGMTREKLRMEMLPRTILRSSVERLIDSLRSPGRDENAAVDTFITEAKYLYSKLIAPVKPLLIEGARLIIIPDEVLCGLPFEVLFEKGSRKKDYPDFDYLLSHYSFRYGYSATALREMEKKQHRNTSTKRFLGVAPVFPGPHTGGRAPVLHESPRNFDLDSLEHNIPEVRNVWKIMGKNSDTLIGGNATKSNFLAQAGQYRVILLSTHGLFNDFVVEHSFVAFTESPAGDKTSRYLLMPEVEAMTLNCDLLALSACQTALGRLRRGEGVISLTRMFAFAGAKSLLGTLWNVNDKASRELMEDFFKNLNGQPKDKALQQAKINYIQKQKEEKKKYPYYWAAYILVGDDTPLVLTGR